MQTAEAVLNIIRERGQRGLPLERVYRHLYNHDLYLRAYGKLYRNKGAMTSGATPETVDRMSLAKIDSLIESLRQERYHWTPVRRTHIPKAKGKRPLGLPTWSDKLLQEAIRQILEAYYEPQFSPHSHGFGPGRGCHTALREIQQWPGVKWFIEGDIRACFDAIPHNQLREMIKQRVKDGGILRLIGKWLNAGVMEAGEVSYADKGSPQGGVISPMLANVYLHYVLDEWYEQEVKPRLSGRSFLIRFADDFIIGCELERDARRIMAVLPKRFGRYGLSIHPDKTKLVKFGKPSRKGPSSGRNGTFDFLGFTHYWAKSRRGYWVIKRKTAGKRQRRTIKAIWQWCKENRHQPLPEQYRMLCLKLRGHYQYYGIRSNYRQLENAAQEVRRAWRYWLNRRGSQRNMDWEKFEKLLKQFPLPIPRIVHNI